MTEIRAVVIGYGGMGRQYAKLLAESRVKGMVLSGVCCRNAAGQQKARENFPGIRIYQNVEETFAHAKEFDAVVIVTPHGTHVEIGIKAARAGKYILCDKPAGVTTKEVRELMKVLEEKDISCAMIFNTRMKSAFAAAKEMMDDGSLGTVTRAVWVCNTWYRTPAYHNSAPWRSTWKGEHGGLLINQCQHYLDIWQWLFGMPDELYASLDFGKYNDFAVDDGADIQFFYKGGMHGTFISSSGENPGVNRLEIWGTKGRLCIEDCQMITLDENVMDTVEFAGVNTEIYGKLDHNLYEIITDPPVSGDEGGYCRLFQNFADHILKGTPLYADLSDGLRTLMLANGAYLSAWQEKKISVPIDDVLYARLLKEVELRENRE